MFLTIKWMVLKYIIFINAVMLCGYAAWPFINGFGCDYQYSAESNDSKLYTTCKYGYVESVYIHKAEQDAIYYSGFFGVKEDDLFFIVVNKKVKEQTAFSKSKYVSFVKLDDTTYISAKKIKRGHNLYMATKLPVFSFYKIVFNGHFGFIE